MSAPALRLILVSIAALAAAPAFPAEPFSAAAIAFDPKSITLVLARGYEGDLRLVDFADPAKPAARALAPKATAAVFLIDGRLAAGGADGTIRLWSLETGAETARIQASVSPIASLAVSPRHIAAVDENLVLRIWQHDGRSVGRPLQMRRQKSDAPCTSSAVALAPDETAVAAISCTGDVYAWTLSGQILTVPRGRGEYEGCCGWQIGFSADGRYLVARRSYQPGYEAFVWTRRGGQLAGGRLLPGSDQLKQFALLPNTADLLIYDALGLRRLSPTGAKGAVIVPEGMRGFAVSADGSRIATLMDGQELVFRAGDGRVLGRIALQ